MGLARSSVLCLGTDILPVIRTILEDIFSKVLVEAVVMVMMVVIYEILYATSFFDRLHYEGKDEYL